MIDIHVPLRKMVMGKGVSHSAVSELSDQHEMVGPKANVIMHLD